MYELKESDTLEELYKDDIYAQTYGELFTDKIEQLADVILNQNTSPDKFTVFALESGLGKSKYTNKIIDESLTPFGNKKTYLVVKRFKEDVVAMENALSHHNSSDRIIPTVLGITGDNWSSKWKEQIDKIKNIDVIIITHSRYIALCLDDDLRSAFSQNREVLIIDEKINFPTYSFSKKTYAKVREILLSVEMEVEYEKVCKKLREILKKRELNGDLNKCVRVNPNIHPSTLRNFIELVELNLKDYKKTDEKNKLENFKNGLEHWYSEMCIYNGGNIITFDRRYKLWGLTNNIILDASSNVDGVYQISNDFNVVGTSRIIDHSNSSFHVIPFNTSKSNVQKNQNEYYIEIAQKIKKYHEVGDQTLIICQKNIYPIIEKELLRLGITDIHIPTELIDGEHQEERVLQSFAINWFGNLIGKNVYADFSNCWIIGTPNIPLGQYLMQYMMYTKQRTLTNKKLDIKFGKFKNAEFSKIQKGYVASDIYQSIKRIQRNVRPNGKFFIVNSNEDIVNLVLGEIKGAEPEKRREIQLQFVEKQKQESEKNNKVDKFIEYMRDRVPLGTHRKKDIIDELKISNFSRLFKYERVKELEIHGYIKINKHTIEKNMEWSTLK